MKRNLDAGDEGNAESQSSKKPNVSNTEVPVSLELLFLF
jgi:hypothetical protein